MGKFPTGHFKDIYVQIRIRELRDFGATFIADSKYITDEEINILSDWQRKFALEDVLLDEKQKNLAWRFRQLADAIGEKMKSDILYKESRFESLHGSTFDTKLMPKDMISDGKVRWFHLELTGWTPSD